MTKSMIIPMIHVPVMRNWSNNRKEEESDYVRLSIHSPSVRITIMSMIKIANYQYADMEK